MILFPICKSTGRWSDVKTLGIAWRDFLSSPSIIKTSPCSRIISWQISSRSPFPSKNIAEQPMDTDTIGALQYSENMLSSYARLIGLITWIISMNTDGPNASWIVVANCSLWIIIAFYKTANNVAYFNQCTGHWSWVLWFVLLTVPIMMITKRGPTQFFQTGSHLIKVSNVILTFKIWIFTIL